MATEKQIKANRENAKRSTGPKSSVGKSRSSRNALRHGLSIPADTHAPETQAYASVTFLAPEGVGNLESSALAEMAHAQSQLLRVSAVRKVLLDALDLQSPALEQMRRLVALERYECRARRLRRRAAAQLLVSASTDDKELAEQTQFDVQ